MSVHESKNYIQYFDDNDDNIEAMDYNVGSRVRVKLYGGKIIEAEITAIVNQSTGRKIRISFGKESVAINPEQIIEVLD
jgi:hypothetical protein